MTEPPEAPLPVDPTSSPSRFRLRNPLRGLPPEVAVLSAVAFCVALGFGIVAPAIPLFAKQFDVANTAAGAVVSAFALMRLVSAPVARPAGQPARRAADPRHRHRHRRRVQPARRAGPDVPAAARAARHRRRRARRCSPSARTACCCASRRPTSAAGRRAPSRPASCSAASPGPPSAARSTAWSIRAPFFLYAGTLLLAGTIATVFLARAPLRERGRGRERARADRRSFDVALRDPAYRAALVNNFANGWSVFGSGRRWCRCSSSRACCCRPRWTGAGLFVWAVVEGIVLLTAGRYVDQRGRRPYLRGGAALCVIAALVLAFSGRARCPSSPRWRCSAAASAMLSTSSAAVVGDVIGGRGGTAVAAYQMSSDARRVDRAPRRRPAVRPVLVPGRVPRDGCGVRRRLPARPCSCPRRATARPSACPPRSPTYGPVREKSCLTGP